MNQLDATLARFRSRLVKRGLKLGPTYHKLNESEIEEEVKYRRALLIHKLRLHHDLYIELGKPADTFGQPIRVGKGGTWQ